MHAYKGVDPPSSKGFSFENAQAITALNIYIYIPSQPYDQR